MLQPHTTTWCVVNKFNITVGDHDIRTLRDRQWLNDEVVNFYVNLLMDRANKEQGRPSIHCFNTFFYPTLRDSGYQKVRRWTKKVDLFTKDFVIIPIHLGMHWCCAVINFRSKRFEYYDSLFGDDRGCFALFREYIRLESLDKKKQEFDLSGWTDYEPKDIPGQANGYDCGVFACTFAEYVSRAEPFDFTQKNMKHMRALMTYEIASGELLHRRSPSRADAALN
ncbi:hypothetical protein THASP1DRAFT_35243 [Thamnocephalis sphaerospora]|uniref:Ubiquitin-like protease family profile domain-containing protein n=1 Tax=Thamnocephalis sphaerospora TaxID=78915 RepID=A0A4P9XKY0_9FUNG|nr:hypothetical protein THASP1DRAFT_35243 [Thamnocephalis sphaerospora]|eukprot:RKP05940.1 hypothetical protein THASP1DRAFT_35243 [Thamnocephalis sphaerospora]